MHGHCNHKSRGTTRKRLAPPHPSIIFQPPPNSLSSPHRTVQSGMASSPPSLPLVLFALALLLALSPPASGISGGGEKRTRIRVYVHEQFTGANATVGSVARSLLGENSTFGDVGVVDDVLRSGPRATSQEIGRYQGLFAGADLADDNYLSAITLVFAKGQHRGSTLSLQGSYSFPAGETVERAVVGGTGAFRMARGFSLLKVVDAQNDSAVFQLDLSVFTPRGIR